MILTHGGNSVGRDNGNYIYDNFVALYNGVTDSGYAINDGSFGQLLWDANGPIQAPNGQGTPYYARANFTGDNGGVQAIYDGLKSVFSSSNAITADFYFYQDTSAPLDNYYVFGAYNNDRSSDSVAVRINDAYRTESYISRADSSFRIYLLGNKTWHHIAIILYQDRKIYAFVDGSMVVRQGQFPTSIPSDINTLRFRFYGNAGGIRIAQFALRDYAVWTSNFTPPTLLYKQI